MSIRHWRYDPFSARMCCCVLGAIATAVAGAASASPPGGASQDALQEIVVSAAKTVNAVSVHDSPYAVTGFDQSALEDAHVGQLSDLTNYVPNVFLNSTETVQGVNNFSIRGMAVYDTIPSNTPTVGVFVDGLYLGASAASALNTFDLGSIEVLRGPQGLLFGQNVTAGAILVHTSNPADRAHVSARIGVESDPSFTESLVLTGPVMSDGRLDGKIAVYRNDDSGYFTNLYDNRKFGASRTTIVRGALLLGAHSLFRTIVRYEHGSVGGQGPASQNHGAYSRDTFDFSINTAGFEHDNWNQAIAESRRKVAFGNGEVVNILGWRDVREAGLFDADSTPETFFNFGTDIEQHQYSDELRYSGTLGRVTPTVGAYFYTDHLLYVENRQLAAANLTGGGIQNSTTYALYSNFDIVLARTLTLTLGARYALEKKNARVEALKASAGSFCSFAAVSCAGFDFAGHHLWGAFTPKVELQWRPTPATEVYGYWTKGFRSGGYNLRQTNALVPPGPYAQEVENTVEAGIKQRLVANRVSVNADIFGNEFSNLQRAIIQASPVYGIEQTTLNSADTRIFGAEMELSAVVLDGFRIAANMGYLHNQWRHIYYNLLGAGTVTSADYRLQLPFLSPWSYGVSATYLLTSRLGDLIGTLSYAHRDATPSNDSNTGWLKTVDDVDASVTLNAGDRLSYSIYAKNLTNEVTYGLNNPLTFTRNETIAPLNKGRVIGGEIRYGY